jgi:hypothetical protein
MWGGDSGVGANGPGNGCHSQAEQGEPQPGSAPMALGGLAPARNLNRNELARRRHDCASPCPGDTRECIARHRTRDK